MKNQVQTPCCSVAGFLAKPKSHKISALILMLAGLLGGSANAQLLHRYDFAATGNANDTVGAANGTVEGAATISGGALNTAGTAGGLNGGVPQNGVMLPGTAVAGITNAFTIETWFIANYVGGGYSTLFSFSANNQANYVLATPARGNSPYPSGVAVVGGGGNTTEQQAGGIYLDNGSGPHDMMIVFDGTNLTYYLDGTIAPQDPISAVQQTFTDPGLVLSNLTYIGIAGGSPYPDNSMNGQTFDFRIYGQALTSAQVATIDSMGTNASNASISAALVPPTAFVWNGGGADNNWSTALNWVSGIAPALSGTSLTFAGNIRTTPNLNASYSVSGLSFSNNAGSFSIGTASSSTLTLAGDVINNSANVQTLNVPVSLNVGAALNAASGNLVVNSNITLGASSLTLNGNNNFTLNGNISGAGNFIKNGAGALNLGGSSLTAGTVSFNNGTATISGAVTSASGSGTTYVGYLTGTGVVTMASGTLNTGGEVRVGGSDQNGAGVIGSGTLTLNGGTANLGALTVARGNYLDNTESGTVTLNSGSTMVSSNDVILEFAGMGLGKMAINGGNFILGPTALKWFTIGWFDTGAGELDITNGNFFLENSSSIKMCRGGNTGGNVVNQNGGAVTFFSDAGVTVGGTGNLDVNYGGGGSSSSTYNLNGGTLTVPQIIASSGSGSSIFNFNGGTLKPTASTPTFIQGLTGVAVLTGGAIIDTTNLNITIAQNLQDGGGGLTKVGNGTLTLSSGYGYSGPTIVQGGTLSLDASQSSSASALTVSNAALSLLLNNGNSALTAGNLTFNGISALNLNFGTATSPSTPAINASGYTVSNTGTNIINIMGQYLVVGQYPLIYTGSSLPTNNFKLGTLPTGVVATLVNSGSSLDLLITAAGQNLVWYGADNLGNPLTNWDINVSSNWNSGNAKYLQYSGNSYGDNVTFDDTVYPGNTSVNLAVRVVPVTVQFSDFSQAYSVTGTGGIDGATSLVVTNTGSLFLGTSNNFTGGTVIGGGATLIITNDNALGNSSGGVALAGGTLQLNASLTSSRSVAFTGTSIIDVGAGSVANLNGLVSGNGTLDKNDNGTLTLAGNNTYSGSTTVNGGTLNVSGAVTNTIVTVGAVAGNTALGLSGNVSANSLLVGNTGSSVAALIQTGGNTVVNGGGGDCLNIGNIAGAFGYYNAIAGTLTANGIAVGGENNTGAGFTGTGGDGLMEINGAIVNDIGWFVMSRGATTETGVLNVFNGSLAYAGGGLVCDWGSGQTAIINIMGGSVTSTNAGFGLGAAGNTGILNLNGGIAAGTVVGGNFNGTFGQLNFNGGTLKAAGNSASFVKVTSANIYSNGGTIDDGGYSITVSQPLLAPVGYGVSSISLSAGGSGYVVPPIVTISGGTGSNATAIATISGGVVTGITVTSPGSGYAASDSLSVNFESGGASAVAPTVSSVLLTPNTSGGLTKQGSGTLTLTGTNTYAGPTKISAGTLAGTGVIAGALTNNATFAPGNGGVGALTVNGNITLKAGSTNTFTVNGTTPTNSSVIAGGNVVFGGVLKINASGSLTAGQQFVLFSGIGATNVSNFASVQSTGSSATFGFTNGVLTVMSAIASNPTNIMFNVSGGTLSLSWPADHLGWVLQSQTNGLSVGLTTNWVDVAGSASITSTNITINPVTSAAFYRLRSP